MSDLGLNPLGQHMFTFCFINACIYLFKQPFNGQNLSQ